MTRTRAALLVSLGCLIFVWVLISSFNFWEVKQPVPPHELKTTRVEPSVVVPDETGAMKIKLFTTSIRREADCYVQIYRTFTNASTNRVVLQMVSIGGQVPATGKPTEFPFEMELPADLFPPGRYSYTAFALNKCSESRTFTVPADMSYFEVVARP